MIRNSQQQRGGGMYQPLSGYNFAPTEMPMGVGQPYVILQLPQTQNGQLQLPTSIDSEELAKSIALAMQKYNANQDKSQAVNMDKEELAKAITSAMQDYNEKQQAKEMAANMNKEELAKAIALAMQKYNGKQQHVNVSPRMYRMENSFSDDWGFYDEIKPDDFK